MMNLKPVPKMPGAMSVGKPMGAMPVPNQQKKMMVAPLPRAKQAGVPGFLGAINTLNAMKRKIKK